MQCSFCHNKIQHSLYSCIAHPEVTACQGCYDYTCNRCRAELKKTQLQFCIGCKQHKQSSRMFGKRYEAFCLECCQKAYKNNIQGKKVVLCKHLHEFEKFDVYRFLRMFCYRCKCDIRHGDLDSGLREIYPLNTNLCSSCAMKPQIEQNFSFGRQAPTPTFRAQTYQQAKPFTTTRVQQKSPQLSSSRSQTRISQTKQTKKSSTNQSTSFVARPRTPQPSPPLHQSSSKTSIYETSYHQSSSTSPKMYSKESKIPNTSTAAQVIGGISGGASKLSQAQAIEKWKRIQGSEFLKCMACGHLVLEDGVINDEVVVCDYCIRKARIEEEIRNNRTTVNQIEDRNHKSNIYSESTRVNQNTKYYDPYTDTSRPQKPKSPAPAQQSQPIKKQTSQTSRTKSPTFYHESFHSDRDRYDYERQRQNPRSNVHSSNLPFDQNLLVQCSKCGIRLELDAANWEDQNARALCRCCYLDHLEVQRRLRERMGSKYSTSPYRKPEAPQPRSNLPQSPIISPQLSPTQPIIREQDSPPQNGSRVRRSQSWDESIVIEPVQDHERRKREKKMKEDNINTIHQVNQEEVILQRKSQSKVSERSSQVRIQERRSQKIIQERKIGPIEPIIIQDSEEKKSRIKSKLSWDDNIILQPINKSKPSSPEKSRLSAQQTNQYEQKSKPVQKGPIDPIIIQEQAKERRRVQKMQSWDENIILQPVADHLRRKKQKLQSQLNDKNIKKVQQKTQIRRQQKRQYSRSPIRQRQTKSPLRQKDPSLPQQKETRSPMRTTNEQSLRTNINIRREQEIRNNRTGTGTGTGTRVSEQRKEEPIKTYEEYNSDFDNKYKEIKKKLDDDMKIGLQKLEKYAEEEEKLRSLQNSRISAYSRYNNSEHQSVKTSLTNSRAEKPATSVYYNPYGSQASVGLKSDDRSTLYSPNGSRAREMREDISGSRTRNQNTQKANGSQNGINNSPVYGHPIYNSSGYSNSGYNNSDYNNSGYYRQQSRPYQRQQTYFQAYNNQPQHSQHYYQNQPRYPASSYPLNSSSETRPDKPQSVSNSRYKDDLTGYRSLERKQRKFCGFCQTNFQTTLRDYFVRGENVCWECYAEYIKLTIQQN